MYVCMYVSLSVYIQHMYTQIYTFAETVEGSSLCLVTTMIVRGLNGTHEDKMTVSSPASATLRA